MKTAGFLVHSNCGREWFVPLEAVGQDYAEFLMSADGLSEEAAAAQVHRSQDFLQTWFAEQCNTWIDVERLGVLTKKSTLFKTKAALDRRRSRNVEDYDAILPGDFAGRVLSRRCACQW